MHEGEERCETMGRMWDTSGGEPVRMVALTMLAGEAYLALARTSAMHVGALLFFPLPRVNDLRLAVDEACSSFLRAAQESDVDVAAAGPAGTMELCYDRYPDRLQVTVRARAPRGCQTEIGEELGVSQMQVSRLIARILQELRDGFDAYGD